MAPLATWLFLLLIASFVLAVLVGQVRTVVRNGVLEVSIPPFRSRSTPISDIRQVEMAFADNGSFLFGGWSARQTGNIPYTPLPIPYADQAPGAKAVRITTNSGRVFQIGSFRPHALAAAIREQGGPDLTRTNVVDA
jgi:hypothetical protein